MTGRHSAGLGSLVLPPIRTPWVPPPPPPDVALLRRVLDGLRRLQTDPPADLAVPPTAPQAVPQQPAVDLPPLAPRVPGFPHPLPFPPPPEADQADADAAGADAPQSPDGEVPTVPAPHRPLPPRPTRRSGVPGGPAFIGASGMTMPAVDEHAPPYSVDKTHIVSIS
ncbi:MAG TPA: hypothetical protein VGM10_31815 [Actinocrinis sp.]